MIKITGIKQNNLTLMVDGKRVGTLDNDHTKIYLDFTEKNGSTSKRQETSEQSTINDVCILSNDFILRSYMANRDEPLLNGVITHSINSNLIH